MDHCFKNIGRRPTPFKLTSNYAEYNIHKLGLVFHFLDLNNVLIIDLDYVWF